MKPDDVAAAQTSDQRPASPPRRRPGRRATGASDDGRRAVNETNAVRTWLIELSPSECAARLATAPLGRLGVIVDGRPEIFPINHSYDEASGAIVFATNARTKLAAALAWPWVAFEVDGLTGDDADAGWSVLVVGRAEQVVDADEIARAARSRVGTWHSSDHTTWLRIVPDKVTGRRFTRVG